MVDFRTAMFVFGMIEFSNALRRFVGVVDPVVTPSPHPVLAQAVMMCFGLGVAAWACFCRIGKPLLPNTEKPNA